MMENMAQKAVEIARKKCVRINHEMLDQFLADKLGGLPPKKKVTQGRLINWVRLYNKQFNFVRPGVRKDIEDENAF